MSADHSLPIRETASWGDLFKGASFLRTALLAGGVAAHAVNLYLANTVLPSAVGEIGGMNLYAWNTSLFVIGSLLAAAQIVPVMTRYGAKAAYAAGALCFGAGSLACAVAPDMALMLIGRTVQGLGGGLMLAMPYALIRDLYPEALWSRAFALMSSMWGVATLLGPAIGGAFAEAGLWRHGFFVFVPLALALAVLGLAVLPGRERPHGERPGTAMKQLILLCAAVLAASIAGMADAVALKAAICVLAIGIGALALHIESRATHRLLPADALDFRRPLARLFLASALIAVPVTCTEIFVPIFMQTLQGQTPLAAGLVAAAMSAGWSLAAIAAAGLKGARLNRALVIAPVTVAGVMILLAILLPITTLPFGIWSLVFLLVAGGAGVGIAYPHVSAAILATAEPAEADRAGGAIMTVQLCATAFGAALGGLLVNFFGNVHEGTLGNPASAARWLFAVFALGPLACAYLLHKTGPR